MKKISLLILFTSLTIVVNAQTFYDYCQKNGRKISSSYTKVNCVQFMDRALKNYLQIDNKDLSKYIYVNYPMEVVKDALTTNKVEIIGGACYGLVKYNLATWVDIKDIKRGDIVQYWSTDGFINGHCGVFEGYDKFGNVLLIGSHSDSFGYGVMNCYNTTLNCKFFICRLK